MGTVNDYVCKENTCTLLVLLVLLVLVILVFLVVVVVVLFVLLLILLLPPPPPPAPLPLLLLLLHFASDLMQTTCSRYLSVVCCDQYVLKWSFSGIT